MLTITILMDNTVLSGPRLRAQPGFCAWLEADGRKVLFDTGLDGLFLANARALDIDVCAAKDVVLSHGHYDHTGGLADWIQACAPAGPDRPRLVCHPHALDPKTKDGRLYGNRLHPSLLAHHFEMATSRGPRWLSERLVFLGEIERHYPFERTEPRALRLADDGARPDLLLDDSALVYVAEDGLVVLSGCAHAGLCNILRQARRVTGEERILDVVGGMHLIDPPPEQMQGTLDVLHAVSPAALHPAHCTRERFRRVLAHVAPGRDMGVGVRLEYD